MAEEEEEAAGEMAVAGEVVAEGEAAAAVEWRREAASRAGAAVGGVAVAVVEAVAGEAAAAGEAVAEVMAGVAEGAAAVAGAVAELLGVGGAGGGGGNLLAGTGITKLFWLDCTVSPKFTSKSLHHELTLQPFMRCRIWMDTRRAERRDMQRC